MAKPARFVGFLRGINVGGHNKVPMQALRTLLEGEGFEEVATYIQSGNVLFSHAGKTPDALATQLRTLVKKHFTVDVPFIVLTAKRYTALVATQPFGAIDEANEKFVHLGLTQTAVPAAAQAMLEAKAKAGERVVVCTDKAAARCGWTTARASPRASSRRRRWMRQPGNR